MFLSLHGEVITSSPVVTLFNTKASAETKSQGRFPFETRLGILQYFRLE